ncbi:putative HTH-type transcriptional regulator YjjM [Hartmannibacter diazotrophicus]|uniref:Putative HTH-type transcriptional regulator YjjM n=1 Tax=Hartmannibacter diazotrophicus TaxID=1482074 RepID=A0A2C9DA92_9HYPH|nr:GntR family transcriptional regulator [Hartmannibacter diazotrophicus]SON56661.1 putative HTH-type transcriptional regulator YjjM [Hartmannibacter diazotrophicus]
MARTDERFREAFNTLLDHCANLAIGDQLPAEHAIAAHLEVSRTIVRSVLERLQDEGIIRWESRAKTLLRAPRKSDRLAVQADPLSAEELERQFLDWVLRFDVPPETTLNVTELARKFGVPAYALQEFLASLSRFGLVRRRPKGGWELVGFTREFAVELSDFRTMLELNAVSHLVTLPAKHGIWHRLDELEKAHRKLAEEIDTRYHDFSLLDEQFHTAIGSVVKNRFVAEFQKVITLIFHYHYQWDKKDERDRNLAAIGEHLRIIGALKARNEAEAIEAARDHLKTSKQTLLSSMRNHALV